MPDSSRVEQERHIPDHLDRKLVLLLQRDGRSSYARLAEEVGMSQAGVRARVQRLLDSGMVQIAAVADPFAFGFSLTALVGITYTGNLDKLGQAVAAMEQVHFVALTAGRYDGIAEVVCVDTDDMLALQPDESQDSRRRDAASHRVGFAVTPNRPARRLTDGPCFPGGAVVLRPGRAGRPGCTARLQRA